MDGFGAVCISRHLLGRAVRRVAGRGGGGKDVAPCHVMACGCRLAGVGVGVVRGLGWHIEMFLACRGGRVGWSANL